MPREARALLLDMLRAAVMIEEGSSGLDLESYRADPWAQSAIERQLIVVGEAVRRLKQVSPEIAARLPEASRLVGFRNVLVHSYEQIDVELVWQAIQTRLPRLREEIERLLSDPAL